MAAERATRIIPGTAARLSAISRLAMPGPIRADRLSPNRIAGNDSSMSARRMIQEVARV
ncbi:hypothetical protein D3C71_2077710 [compost metagenome]